MVKTRLSIYVIKEQRKAFHSYIVPPDKHSAILVYRGENDPWSATFLYGMKKDELILGYTIASDKKFIFLSKSI